MMLSQQRVKYPRTPHFSSSPGASQESDAVFSAPDFSLMSSVIITEKMDGENTTLYADGYVHARSIDSASHVTQDWVRAMWATKSYLLPEGWRVCGENLYAVHSLQYSKLASFFMVFSIWDENNQRILWDDMVEWCALLDMTPVPLLYKGVFSEEVFEGLVNNIDLTRVEGLVCCADIKFNIKDFSLYMAKWVRPNHVTSSKHWKHDVIKVNGLQT